MTNKWLRNLNQFWYISLSHEISINHRGKYMYLYFSANWSEQICVRLICVPLLNNIENQIRITANISAQNKN